jgi:hypothetical protein
MLFTLASTFAFSALMTASPGTCRWGFATPSIRPPGSPTFLLPTPVVVLPVEFEALVVEPLDPEVAAPDPDTEPDELAVPTVFVPGEVGTFDALPAPLGSFAALFNPPGLAGPLGTPLTAAVPAPVEPAFGDPTALAVPAVGPLAAPVGAPPVDAPAADPPPPLVPPPEPPPDPPPPLWA